MDSAWIFFFHQDDICVFEHEGWLGIMPWFIGYFEGFIDKTQVTRNLYSIWWFYI